MFISPEQQSSSVIRVYIVSHILFYFGLSRGPEYRSLSCTVGPCLSSLHIIVCSCESQTPSHPLGTHRSILCVWSLQVHPVRLEFAGPSCASGVCGSVLCVCEFASQTSSSVSCFRSHTSVTSYGIFLLYIT